MVSVMARGTFDIVGSDPDPSYIHGTPKLMHLAHMGRFSSHWHC